jgi:17beta-estradiol 17-dehydrogenase / very-long-chain 3-oxoacyl-CoA reductase
VKVPYLELFPSWLVHLLLVVALLWFLRWVFGVLNFVFVYFLRPGKDLKKFGKWAIVTGSTDGIGKAIADELAAKGISLVLISRTKSKLEDQAKELSSKFSIETKIHAMDFSSGDLSMFDRVKEVVQGLDVGLLVNNVGMSYDHAEYFHLVDKQKIENLVRINIFGTTHMTYVVLPGMLERKRGAIVNISSASGFVSEPMYAVYSATKAFVNTFSQALHYEYKSQGVHVQCQVPAFVTTKLSKLRSTSFFICSPKAYAKSLISKIGYEPIIFSYWTHSLQIDGALSLPIPDWIRASFLLSRGKDIRRRAYAKKGDKKN